MQPHCERMNMSEQMQLVITADEASTAHEIHKRIINLRRSAEMTFLDLGKALFELREIQGWHALGYETMREYVGSPEVDLTPRMSRMLVGVYRKYILELQVDTVLLLDVGISKLDKLTSVVDAESVSRWLNKAATLSRSDLTVEVGVTTTNSAEWMWRLNRARGDLFHVFNNGDTPEDCRKAVDWFLRRVELLEDLGHD